MKILICFGKLIVQKLEFFYNNDLIDDMLDVIDESQGLFGADEYMDWAQIMKAEAFYAMENYEQAEESYNMILLVC